MYNMIMKKKILLSLTIVIILSMLGFVLYKKKHNIRADHLILCLGDSLTESGYGSYVGHLNKLLGENDLRTKAVSAARPGNNSGEYLRFLQNTNILTNTDPEIILLLIGTNDVRIDSDKTSRADFVKNMQDIIHILSKHKNGDGSKPLIFIMTIPPIFKMDLASFSPQSSIRIAREINPSIKKLGSENSLKLIDLNTFFRNKPELLPGIHPSRRGYSKMAGFIFGRIKNFMQVCGADEEERLPSRFRGKIAFQSDRTGNEDIFILNNRELVQVTRNRAEDGYPVFSPDGEKLVFESDRSGKFELYCKDLQDQSLTKLFSSPTEDRHPFWTYKGEQLYFSRSVKGRYQIFRYDFESGKILQITDYRGKNALPAVSPSGRFLLITSNRLFGWNVHKIDLKTTISEKFSVGYGGCRARYSHSGDKIVWVSHKVDNKGDLFVTASNKFEPFRLTIDSEKHDYYPCFSPDDKYIVYASGPHLKSGNYNIRIIDLKTHRIWQITSDPAKDILPFWSE
jgi:TolB protein